MIKRPFVGTRRTLVQACIGLFAGLVGLTGSTASMAQSFPSRPIRIIVPAAAGGNLDLVSRNFAQKLSEQLGQQVIVENRAGGNYMVAVDVISKAPADGYTYLAIADSFLYTPAVSKTATFDPIQDFVGVGLMAKVPLMLVVHPSIPVRTSADLIALAKRTPAGDLTYGTSGNGSTGHIAAELFSMQAGVRMTHVPYKGNAPALLDVMGGRTSLMLDPLSTSAPHVKAGKLKALGIASKTRSPLFPDLPTIHETGLPGYEASIFNGLVARAGTSPEIVQRMNAELRKIVQQPDLRARMLEQGVELVASESPQEFNTSLKGLMEKYAQIIKSANIKGD